MASFDTNELLGQLNCLAELQIAIARLNFSFCLSVDLIWSGLLKEKCCFRHASSVPPHFPTSISGHVHLIEYVYWPPNDTDGTY